MTSCTVSTCDITANSHSVTSSDYKIGTTGHQNMGHGVPQIWVQCSVHLQYTKLFNRKCVCKRAREREN